MPVVAFAIGAALLLGGLCLIWFGPEIQASYVRDAENVRHVPLIGKALYDWPASPGYLLGLRIGGAASALLGAALVFVTIIGSLR
jgi:hypothetical protein